MSDAAFDEVLRFPECSNVLNDPDNLVQSGAEDDLMMIFRIQLEFFRSTLESKEEKLQLNFLKW
jgi:hypothetical protein